MLLFIFVIILVLNSFAQTQNINVTVKEEKDPYEELNKDLAAANARLFEARKEEGVKYLGNGKYKIILINDNGFKRKKKFNLQVNESIQEFANNNGATNYEILYTHLTKPSGLLYWRGEVDFNLLNDRGDVMLNKDDAKADKKAAKQELLDLKELLDMGIISQEEFNKKAKELKKILLAD